MAPAPLSFKTRGGGGLGGVAYKDRAWPPPPPPRGVTHSQAGSGGGGHSIATENRCEDGLKNFTKLVKEGTVVSNTASCMHAKRSMIQCAF